MWPAVASHSLAFIAGFGLAAVLCLCDCHHPNKPPPPLK